MDIIKGLTRLQSNIETLLASAESAEDPHLSLLKHCYTRITLLIKNPETVDVALIDQLAIDLSQRSRNRDQLPEEDYDRIVVGLKLLAKMRQVEIDSAYGPSSQDGMKEEQKEKKDAVTTIEERVFDSSSA